MNALDNRAARNHVNRMCLAADVPLIESGTAGYAGQVNYIFKVIFNTNSAHHDNCRSTGRTHKEIYDSMLRVST